MRPGTNRSGIRDRAAISPSPLRCGDCHGELGDIGCNHAPGRLGVAEAAPDRCADWPVLKTTDDDNVSASRRRRQPPRSLRERARLLDAGSRPGRKAGCDDHFGKKGVVTEPRNPEVEPADLPVVGSRVRRMIHFSPPLNLILSPNHFSASSNPRAPHSTATPVSVPSGGTRRRTTATTRSPRSLPGVGSAIQRDPEERGAAPRLHPIRRQRQRDRAPDAAPPADNERDAAVESEVHRRKIDYGGRGSMSPQCKRSSPGTSESSASKLSAQNSQLTRNLV